MDTLFYQDTRHRCWTAMGSLHIGDENIRLRHWPATNPESGSGWSRLSWWGGLWYWMTCVRMSYMTPRQVQVTKFTISSERTSSNPHIYSAYQFWARIIKMLLCSLYKGTQATTAPRSPFRAISEYSWSRNLLTRYLFGFETAKLLSSHSSVGSSIFELSFRSEYSLKASYSRVCSS